MLLDNHLTGNVILSVIDPRASNPIPDVVWDRVEEVREVMYRAIVELSPPDWSFVFTNVLRDDDPMRPRPSTRVRAAGRASGPAATWPSACTATATCSSSG